MSLTTTLRAAARLLLTPPTGPAAASLPAPPARSRPAPQATPRTDHARDIEALDYASAATYGTAEATRAAALAAGISDTQWKCARSIVLRAPHLADAVRSGELPLGHAAGLARAYRYDPATAARAEQALTGNRWRDSYRVRGARETARRSWQSARRRS